jgi:hypothetical protein
MNTFACMKIRRLIQAGAVIQLTRYVLNRREQARQRRRQKTAISVIAVAAGGAAAWWFISQRREATPAWILKKQRKQERREAARLEQERPVARPGPVHVEAEAETDLKVPLGEHVK